MPTMRACETSVAGLQPMAAWQDWQQPETSTNEEKRARGLIPSSGVSSMQGDHVGANEKVGGKTSRLET